MESCSLVSLTHSYPKQLGKAIMICSIAFLTPPMLHLQSSRLNEVWYEVSRRPDEVAKRTRCIGPCFIILISKKPHQCLAARPQGLVQLIGVVSCKHMKL